MPRQSASTKTIGAKIKPSTNRRQLVTYSEQSLKLALSNIRDGSLGIREASRQFGVPKSTIQDRLSGKCPDHIRKTGPPPLLTVTGEKRVAEWAINMAKQGFPIKKATLLNTVAQIAKESSLLNKFKNGTPSEKWYKNFMKRHPELSIREAESINKARAIVTEESIRSWFQDLSTFLKDNKYEEVMTDPRRIFNGDESGFSMCPKTGKVLAPRGCKNLYAIKLGNEKELITVLIVFNANGEVCPPLVIFPYVRPPKALVNNMPKNWVLGRSDSGWMKGDVFFEYVCNDFNKWIVENNIPKPVILFIDGHRSHMTLALSTFCDENGIILYALPANTTHILQPADVSVFRPLKHEWKNTIRKWQNDQENPNITVNKMNFCRVFQHTIDNTSMERCIKNGFRKCGLFPLDPNSVDYSKCVKNVQEQSKRTPVDLPDGLSPDRITLKEIEITKKVVKKIENSLYQVGINVEVVYNELLFLKTQLESFPQSPVPAHDDQQHDANRQTDLMYSGFEEIIPVGAVVPMNNLEIIPCEIIESEFEEDNRFNGMMKLIDEREPNVIDTADNNLMEGVTTTTVDRPTVQPLLSGKDNKIQQKASAIIQIQEKNENKTQIYVEQPLKLLDNSAITQQELPEYHQIQKENLTDQSEIIESLTENSEATSIEFAQIHTDHQISTDQPIIIDDGIQQIENSQNEESSDSNQIQMNQPLILNDSEIQGHSQNGQAREENASKVQKRKLDLLDTNDIKILEETSTDVKMINTENVVYAKSAEKTPLKNNDNENKTIILPSPFSKHLVFPEPVNKNENSRKKEKLPSAISSERWRLFYEKKDKEKEEKIEKQRKRKEEKATKNAMPKKKATKPKTKGQNKTEDKTIKVPIKCTFCEEDLLSETEEDAEKNLGCDFCPNWYHLGCTEYAGLQFEQAAKKSFRCEFCKE